MRQFKDVNWNVPTMKDGRIQDWDAVRLSVLMDIRDELRQLNRLLGCQNFIEMPAMLRAIKRNTAKPRKAS